VSPPLQHQLAFRALAAGELQVETITPADAERIAELIDTYGDLGLSGTMRALIVVAKRLAAPRMATLDRRHFGAVRPSHTTAFELVLDIAAGEDRALLP
jgi:hypothetical protein